MTMTETRVTKALQKKLVEIKKQIKKQIGVDIGNKTAQEILVKLADGKTTIIINKKNKIKVQ